MGLRLSNGKELKISFHYIGIDISFQILLLYSTVS